MPNNFYNCTGHINGIAASRSKIELVSSWVCTALLPSSLVTTMTMTMAMTTSEAKPTIRKVITGETKISTRSRSATTPKEHLEDVACIHVYKYTEKYIFSNHNKTGK